MIKIINKGLNEFGLKEIAKHFDYEFKVGQNVDQIIQQLKDMEVDGETMQHILEQVGMDDQMHRQLIMTKPIENTKNLLEEKWLNYELFEITVTRIK